jgi:trigger factor
MEAKNKLVEKLVDAHSFPVPEAMVQRQLEIRMERLVRQLQQQGINPEQSIDWNAWRDNSVEPATKEVRAELLLDKIGERESLDATDQEFDDEIRYMARAMRQSEDAVRSRIKREETEGRVRYRIRNGKAQDFLFKNARYVAPTTPDQSEEAEAAEAGEAESHEHDEHDHHEHEHHDEVSE